VQPDPRGPGPDAEGDRELGRSEALPRHQPEDLAVTRAQPLERGQDHRTRPVAPRLARGLLGSRRQLLDQRLVPPAPAPLLLEQGAGHAEEPGPAQHRRRQVGTASPGHGVHLGAEVLGVGGGPAAYVGEHVTRGGSVEVLELVRVDLVGHLSAT